VTVFGRPFVKRFALCYQTVVCLSVLSVKLAYCGQTVECIKMKLCMQVGLGHGHVATWGPSSPFPCCGQTAGRIKMALDTEYRPRPRGHCVRWRPHSPSKGGHSTPNIGTCIVAKRLHGSRCHLARGRPRLRPHCVTLGPNFPLKRHSSPRIFGPCLLWPNGWVDQDAT